MDMNIVYIKKMWHDKFKERQDNVFAIDIMINFYYDVLKYKINGQVSVFVDEIELIKKIREKDTGLKIIVLSGFDDYSHFIATFKKVFHTTPLKYKKNIANPELITQELHRCANELASCDVSMQTLKKIIRSL